MTIKENILTFRNLGIDTRQEHVVFMREDCHVCISEGFEALTRLKIANNGRSLVATLNVLKSGLLKMGEISLSYRAAAQLGLKDGDRISVSHLSPFDSMSHVRAKIYGETLNESQMKEIIEDIVEGHYAVSHLSAFVTACAGHRLNLDEIFYLTQSMIDTGDRFDWGNQIIVDKHCIGGLPGNRTTPIIVPIVTAFGLTMPKTSSRAITSPAGTADTMEAITRVTLSMDEMKEIVKKHGGCIAWGGTANLSPADDILIRVEKAIDIDSEGQMIASVLSKKASAGSTHVVIDFPVGDTAKLRSKEAALFLKKQMEDVAERIGLKLKIVLTDGSQPVGRGIGPSLEAMDILAVLRNEREAPVDLKERALLLSGELLELAGAVEPGQGKEIARKILESGQAYKKFSEICWAQGEFKEPTFAEFSFDIKAKKDGTVVKIDNRRLGRIAKLAGAPQNPQSGVKFHSPLGTKVKQGDVLYTIYAETSGELHYALEYEKSHQEIIQIDG